MRQFYPLQKPMNVQTDAAAYIAKVQARHKAEPEYKHCSCGQPAWDQCAECKRLKKEASERWY